MNEKKRRTTQFNKEPINLLISQYDNELDFHFRNTHSTIQIYKFNSIISLKIKITNEFQSRNLEFACIWRPTHGAELL